MTGAPTGGSSKAADDESALPNDFAGTAWRFEGADGARYTTYIDAGGRYRDMRNGQVWHGGIWDTGSDDSLCFTPDGGNVLRRCWHPDKLDGNGTLTATGEDGKRIELTQVDYSAPDPAVTGPARPAGAQ